MNPVNIPIGDGFGSFDRIRFQETVAKFPAKSYSPPSGQLSCRRRMFPGRWRVESNVSIVRSDRREASTSSSISERLKLCTNGLESALNCQSKWLMATFFVGLLLWHRDAAASWAASGSAINFGLSTALKKMLNQERPVSHLRGSEPGMPSSHAQSIFFTSTFAIISMVQYQGFNGFTMLLSPLIFAFGFYLSWLRVSHQFHTINQVKVGAAIGTAFSILWFWSWDAFLLNACISYSWIRNVVTLGAVGYCLGLIVSISQNFFVNGLPRSKPREK